MKTIIEEVMPLANEQMRRDFIKTFCPVPFGYEGYCGNGSKMACDTCWNRPADGNRITVKHTETPKKRGRKAEVQQ